MEDELVVGDAGPEEDAPEETAGEDAGKGDQPAPAKELAEIRKELESLKASNKELSAAAQYWQGRADNGKEKPAPKDEDDLPAHLKDPDAFVDALGEKGIRALDGYVVTKKDLAGLKDELRGMIQDFQGNMGRQANLLSNHPDLGKRGSPLFNATSELLPTIKERYPSLSESEALEIAADQAAVTLRASATQSGITAAERINAQPGSGRPSINTVMDDDQVSLLDSNAKELLGAMKRYGVDAKALVTARKELGR